MNFKAYGNNNVGDITNLKSNNSLRHITILNHKQNKHNITIPENIYIIHQQANKLKERNHMLRVLIPHREKKGPLNRESYTHMKLQNVALMCLEVLEIHHIPYLPVLGIFQK